MFNPGRTNTPTLIFFFNLKIILLNLIRINYIFFDFLVPLFDKGNILLFQTSDFIYNPFVKNYKYPVNNHAHYDIIFNNNINFLTLVLVILIAIGFILFLLTQANLLNLSFYPNSTFDSEKYSPYECGFSPFWTERAQFDIKFYLVALLFLVFDVELMFLLPYCLSYYYLGVLGYIIFLIFFFILIIGFLVEWAVGMLTWRGEEKNPISLQKNVFFEVEKKNKQTNYVKYIIQYLNYLDKFGFGLKYLEYFNILTFIWLWKFKFWRPKRPYFQKYFLQTPENEIKTQGLKKFHEKNPMLFHTNKHYYFGASTYSVVAYYIYVEKKQKQERIERLFTAAYGEPFVEWLETCTPEERDFVL